MAELSLWLDNYDDLYSDFDARALLKRRISEDFIHELEIAFKRKEENTDVLLLHIPGIIRNETDEKLITERLQNHFNREWESGKTELKRNTRRYILFFVISIVVMTFNVLISIRSAGGVNILYETRILLEPAGWFFFWNSLEYFFFRRQAESGKVKFWNMIAGWKIMFRSYK